ncbi:hypothetical protein JQS43_21220 [Natronosporangium hydrolyticum]|uniref:Uncharacterized protein n=1 Tax=Natronosporangium hydrolyticum TaxID=2811111 RepID=A0A895YF46_9ACTN|nr:hypothetical protein [Natronosporangium hydrolyticum]QSB14033.1 hypothetical protein JQS43_21220 [Natronosporangium hydrolyticum]
MSRPDDVPGQVGMARLVPGRPVRLPGTSVEVWWDGDQQLMVYRRAGVWDLSAAVRVGRVLAWTRLADRRHLGWWPLLPLGRRSIYRANSPFPVTDAHRRRAGAAGSGSRAAAQIRSNASR